MWRKRLAEWLLRKTDYVVECDRICEETLSETSQGMHGPTEMRCNVWKARGGYVIDMVVHGGPENVTQNNRTIGTQEKYTSDRYVLANDATGEDLCRAITQLYVSGKLSNANA